MRRLSVSLGALLAACGGPPPLPAAVEPLTPTPDAPFRATPPAVTPSEPALPATHSVVLDNGLSVIVVERPDLPMVSLMFLSRSAHDDGTPSGRGLAAFTARLLDEGTRLQDGQILRHLRIGGLYPWLTVTPEATAMGLDVPVGTFAQSVGLLADLVRHPTFDESAFELARADAGTAIFRQSADAGYQLRDSALTALAGPTHPAVDHPLGVGTNVAHFSHAQVEHFYDEHYGPEQAAFLVVGAVTSNDAVALARRHFGDWASRRTAHVPSPRLEYSNTRAQIQALQNDGDLVSFMLALPCPAISDPHGVDSDLLAMVLANLTLSRTMRSLRHDQGVTYGVHASCEQHPGFGVFWISFAVETEHAASSLAAVLEELRRLQERPISASELSLAKGRYLAELAAELATNRGTASVLGGLFADGLPADELGKLTARVHATTADDIRSTAARFFNGRVGIALAGPYKSLHYELSRFGQVEWLHLSESDLASE